MFYVGVSPAYLAMESATNSNSSLSEPLVCSIEFKSGAIYQGVVAGGKRSGQGTFTWRSGLRYSGQFKNNQRHGYGQQVWPDGSRYEGKFRKDQRHGNGRHEWKNGECYEGEYYSDLKHGKGSYRWPNGAIFTGEFKDDAREGQGTYIDTEGNRFEGLYRSDIRDGEGVLTYDGGRQDVGIWKGTKLVRLTCAISDAVFIPRLKHLFNDISGISLPDTKRRSNSKGFLELASEELMQAAVTGDPHRVTSILKAGAVHVDVCERGGHTPLFAAAIHCHSDIAHLLLHNGADVNAVNVMGVSILTACHHLLYSHHPRVQALLKLLPPSLFTRGRQGGTPTEDSPTGSDHSLHSSSLLSTIPDESPTILEEEEEEGELDGEGVGLVCEEDCDEGGVLMHEECEVSRTDGPASCPSCPPAFKPCRGDSRVLSPGGVTKTSSYPLLEGRQEKKVHFMHEEEEEEEEKEEEEEMEEVEEEEEEDDSMGMSSSLHRDTPAVSPKASLLDLANKSSYPPAGKVGVDKGNEGSPPVSLTRPVRGAANAEAGSSVLMHGSPEPPPPRGFPSDVEVPVFAKQGPVAQTLMKVPSVRSPSYHLTSSRHSPVLQDRSVQTLKKADHLHSSSVFSSTAYGPIVSAAQSTSLLSTSAVSLAKLNNVTPSQEEDLADKRCPQPQNVEGSIDVLLSRGADPNISDCPLPPIVYAICAGDLKGVIRLLTKGARVHSTLPPELGGSSLLELALMSYDSSSSSIAEALLKYGANPNISGGQGKASDEGNLPCCMDVEVVAGENQGASTLFPLHLLCSTEDSKQDVIVEKVKMLLDHGADVNRVANGHSPLSLAIVRGYDQVVDVLLKGGADPNLPLGRGVCSALCSLTLHSALKKRDLQSSLALLGKLIAHKADILLRVRVWDNWPPGTAVDFAHEAFKQDKRLANIKYDSLNKSERLRYKAAKKLTQNMVQLLRARAMDNTHTSAEDLQHSLPVVSRNAGRKRSTSAEPPNLHVSYNQALRRKATSSALPACRASPLPTATTPLLPLKAASEPSGTRRGVARQLSGAHRRRGPPLLERRPITAFTYPPIATVAPTQASGTPCSGTWDFFSFCYECGRSSGVHLSKCPMCKSVCYCSLSCKENSWKTDHRDSCTGWRGPWVGTRRSTAEDKSRSGYGSKSLSLKITKTTPKVVWLPNSLEPFALTVAFPEEEKLGPDC